MTRRIEIQDETVVGTPSLSEYDPPFLAPEMRPETGWGWSLYLRNASGEVVSPLHVHGPMARSAEEAMFPALDYMYRNHWTKI
ncbi:hypothetical protein SAMN05660209_03589 [Geodermatophilus africanus]|uniref:Uncharacterized protein n=1 Tax=Geodermatophilus africanus TaxID=1137993 RepID=A0A1H3M9L9_9ACTN|nr:hypothetical protein [Geodermatophilus africanus]SDY72725.1 hypothetical protein SAMN05660209_03589 [Geodermatophilus africanus]